MGKYGEQNIGYELMNSGIPMYILHDIHYEIDGLSAQIDYIVVTRKVIFVIECKNLVGNIYVDSKGNFIRNYRIGRRRIREGIYSPITQNLRHMRVIKQVRRESKTNFLSKMRFENAFDDRYKSVIVLANPKTIINYRYAKKDVRDQIIRPDQLVQHIKDINGRADIASFSDKAMKELAEELLAQHKPKKSDYSKKYEDLLAETQKSNEKKSKDEIEIEIEDIEDIDLEDFEIEDIDLEDFDVDVEDSKEQEIKEESNNAKSIEEKPTEIKTDKVTLQESAKPNSSASKVEALNKEKLYEELRKYRLDKSRALNIKAYYIFKNAQLDILIDELPQTKEQLLKIQGFGDATVEKYGEDIIQIIQKHIK